MVDQQLAFVATLIVGVTFLASGASKLRDRRGFVFAVLEYRVLPAPLAIAYGRGLPLFELGCGAALVTGTWPKGVGVTAFGLLLSFVVAVSINLARGRRLECHCFGAGDHERLSWVTLARLAVLLVAAALVIAGRPDEWLVDLPPDPLPTILVALGGILALYLLPAAPAVWRVWRGPNLKGVSLGPGRVILRDRARSGCRSLSTHAPSLESWVGERGRPVE